METAKPTEIDRGAFTADLEELAREARELRRALTEVRATAESGDGLIQATASGRGELVELYLDPRIYRVQDSVTLAADVTSTIAAAVDRAREQVLARARKLLPADLSDLEFDPLLSELDRLKGRARP